MGNQAVIRAELQVRDGDGDFITRTAGSLWLCLGPDY
jgi:hypothetical protein